MLVDIGTWPSPAVSIVARGALDGTPLPESLTFPNGTTRFVVYLPDGSSGLLRLELTALDEFDCPRATAEAEVEVGRGLRRISELALPLSAVSAPYCAAPQLESIAPALAANDRQALLTLTGGNFRPGALVTIGGAVCGSPAISAKEIRCTAPIKAGACGVQPVVVKNPDGQSASLPSSFTFYSAIPSFPRGLQPTIATDAFPRRLITADFNADGRADLATANQAGSSISVLLGNGDGTLRLGATLKTTGANAVNGVVAADFNGDQKLDLVAPAGSNNFTFYAGNGDGTFKSGVNIAAGYSLSEAAAADLDGDNKLDLVMSGNTGLFLARGNGDGTFQSTVRISGVSTYGLAVTDLNNDRFLDVAATDSSANQIHVFFGNGNGTFQPQLTDVATGSRPVGLLATDINGDKNVDLLVANSSETSVGLLLGNGDGTFKPMNRIDAGNNPETVVSADVNRDGAPDLVTANSVSNTWSYIPGQPAGGFDRAVLFTAGNGSAGAALADLDRDGSLDVVTANGYDSTVTIFLQQCK